MSDHPTDSNQCWKPEEIARIAHDEAAKMYEVQMAQISSAVQEASTHTESVAVNVAQVEHKLDELRKMFEGQDGLFTDIALIKQRLGDVETRLNESERSRRQLLYTVIGQIIILIIGAAFAAIQFGGTS